MVRNPPTPLGQKKKSQSKTKVKEISIEMKKKEDRNKNLKKDPENKCKERRKSQKSQIVIFETNEIKKEKRTKG